MSVSVSYPIQGEVWKSGFENHGKLAGYRQVDGGMGRHPVEKKPNCRISPTDGMDFVGRIWERKQDRYLGRRQLGPFCGVRGVCSSTSTQEYTRVHSPTPIPDKNPLSLLIQEGMVRSSPGR